MLRRISIDNLMICGKKGGGGAGAGGGEVRRKLRRERSHMPVQTRSRSDKNVVDAKLEKTSLSANVFIRSAEG